MHSDETRYHKKGFLLSFVLKVRVFGTLKYPIDSANLGVYKLMPHLPFVTVLDIKRYQRYIA